MRNEGKGGEGRQRGRWPESGDSTDPHPVANAPHSACPPAQTGNHAHSKRLVGVGGACSHSKKWV